VHAAEPISACGKQEAEGNQAMFPEPGHRALYGSDRWVTMSIFNAVALSLLTPQWTQQIIYASPRTWLTGVEEEEGGRLDASSACKDCILLD